MGEIRKLDYRNRKFSRIPPVACFQIPIARDRNLHLGVAGVCVSGDVIFIKV